MFCSKFQASSSKNKGFTLLELIVTIGVITVGILGAFTVCISIINYTSLSSSRLTATYLAQEGIETVRNIRDTNLVKQESGLSTPWDDGLGANNWEADYNDSNLYLCSSPCNFDDLNFLKIDGGFYNYDSGTNTKFKRKITIDDSGTDFINVSVSVEWEYKGNHEVTVQENLYNWYLPLII